MKLHLICKVFLLSLVLCGCAPTSYVYLKPDSTINNPVDEVLIMVEYLSTKEGFDSHWDFDENLNLFNQDELYDIATQMLSDKGYVVSDKSLKTSGLITHRGFELDHYLNKKKQKQLIAPPYIIRSTNLNNNSIQALEGLLAELNAPISPVMEDYRTHVKNNYKVQTNGIGISEDSAILLIQVYKPRKSLLTNLEFGFNNSNWDSHVGFGSFQSIAKSTAYLIHKGTGDVLWSNKIALINSKNQQKFFAELPIGFLD